MKEQNKPLFLVNYKDPMDDKVVSLNARSVKDSSLGLSFISISDFVFETNRLVIKPSQEQLQKKLEKTKSLHISIYSIISIEAVSYTHLTLPTNREV